MWALFVVSIWVQKTQHFRSEFFSFVCHLTALAVSRLYRGIYGDWWMMRWKEFRRRGRGLIAGPSWKIAWAESLKAVPLRQLASWKWVPFFMWRKYGEIPNLLVSKTKLHLDPGPERHTKTSRSNRPRARVEPGAYVVGAWVCYYWWWSQWCLFCESLLSDVWEVRYVTIRLGGIHSGWTFASYPPSPPPVTAILV
jgi:hypothetical protein